MSGFFITFEGTEGSGKSTQARRLAAALREKGHRVRELREPGGTALAEEIRHLLKHSAAGEGMTPEAELLLVNAARAQLVREVLRPALDAGEIVVCDRFYHSTLAYQGWGRGLPLEHVRQVIEIATGGLRPDLTMLLMVSPEVSALRMGRRAAAEGGGGTGKDRFERADPAFFSRVDAGYLAMAAAEPERVEVVDAGPAEEIVHAHIRARVEARMGRRF